MTLLNLLSDTIYFEEATKLVDRFVGEHDVPVRRSQVYGLRQLAIQQPLAVGRFATHQRERAEKKLASLAPNAVEKRRQPEGEIAFWKMIGEICDDTSSQSPLAAEARNYLPAELRDENIPPKMAGMPTEERGRRKRLVQRQREWLEQWRNEHMPTFLRHLCTHYLYRLGLTESGHEE